MSIELQKSTQFKVNELVIVTKAGPIDISNIYEEINIFDSLFSPVISGSILIRDSVGLSGRLARRIQAIIDREAAREVK